VSRPPRLLLKLAISLGFLLGLIFLFHINILLGTSSVLPALIGIGMPWCTNSRKEYLEVSQHTRETSEEGP
jgi:hypothetical protein